MFWLPGIKEEVLQMKIELVFIACYFLVLYLIAFFANKDYREEDDILFVARSQWHGILIMWLPSLILLGDR